MQGRRSIAKGALAALSLLAGGGTAVLTGLAEASTTPILKKAANASIGKTIAVDSRGRTVYELKPETVHHLLCKASDCLAIWPIVTAPAHGRLIAAKGVKGKLGRLKRGSRFQLTVDGHPLYRFSGDASKGDANGNKLQSFGGTWHVVVESAVSTNTTAMATTTTTSTYTYPGY
jgi:predicted lipoprotein with Yx(FWY)xxD motif